MLALVQSTEVMGNLNTLDPGKIFLTTEIVYFQIYL